MPAAPIAEIIGAARSSSCGVGAFNVIGIEHAEAIVTGAGVGGRARDPADQPRTASPITGRQLGADR